MNVQGSKYEYMMAQQPLELIHKTQMAREFHLQEAEKAKAHLEKTVIEPQKALRASMQGHHGTYGADGKKVSVPQNAQDIKSIDIYA